jgi:hypothetical protein
LKGSAVEVYKIGVRLAMTGNTAAFMSVLIKDLTGAHVKVNQLTGGFTKLKVAIGGALGIWAGEKILSGLTSIVEKTKDLSHELTQVRKLGQQSESDMRAVYENALNVGKKVRGISYSDIIKIYSNVYDTVGGNRKEALALMAPLAKFDVVAGNTLGKFGETLDPNFNRDTIKSAEQMGRLTNEKGEYDEKKFLAYTDLVTKLMTITHGAINPAFMRQMATTGGPVFMGMNDQSLLASSIVGQYMGASRTGTAEMSLMQQFAGGTMFKRNAEAMQDIGLLGKDEWKVSGGRVILAPEARKRLGDLASDPWKLMQTLQKDMTDHGIVGQDAQIKELFAVFARQTTQRFMADLMRNSPQIAKAMEVAKSAMGVDASYTTQQTGDVAQKLADISVAYDRLWNVIAGPKNEAVIAVLDKITGAIELLTDAAAKTNPETLKNLGIGIGIIGTAIVGGAAVAMLAMLGPVGWLAAGVIALGAAVVLWGPKVQLFLGPQGIINFGIQSLGEVLVKYDWKGGFASLLSGLQSLWDKLKGLFGQGQPDNTLPPGFAPGAYHGGGTFMPINYETGSPLRMNSPMGTGDSASTGDGASRRPGRSASTGGGAGGGGIDSVPANITGNAYVGALRAPFGAELSDPNKRMQFAAMLLSEGSPLETAESAMNRSNFANKSLMQMLHSGFYGPINRGQLPKFMAELSRNPKLMAHMNAAIDAALAGSNMIHGFTDQGMPSDPGGRYEMRHEHMMSGGNVFGDWLNGKGTSQWRQNFEDRARGLGAGAVPPPKSNEVHVHNKTILDGRVIANNSMKHIVESGNKSASGGRLYDRSYTRPISI